MVPLLLMPSPLLHPITQLMRITMMMRRMAGRCQISTMKRELSSLFINMCVAKL